MHPHGLSKVNCNAALEDTQRAQMLKATSLVAKHNFGDVRW